MFSITSVTIKLAQTPDNSRLVGYASFVIDECFVIHETKILQDNQGGMFLAMPCRRIQDHCPQCQKKNNIQANYCNFCGLKLSPKLHDGDVKRNLYLDTAHPLTPECRTAIEKAVFDKLDEMDATSESHCGNR